MTETSGVLRLAPTLHDVAREAGVSLATASRVLNGSTRKVAEEYRVRVQAAAAVLGYSANLSAQATARGTSAIIALLVADIADPYFGAVAAGVARGADEAGLVVTVAITGRDRERELRVVRALRGQRPRGVILAASRTGASIPLELATEFELVSATGGTVVALGGGAGGLRTVGVDNRGGARALGRALAGHGYDRAVVLAAAEGVVTSDDRAGGFVEGFTAGGGASPRIYRGGFDRESGAAQMEHALSEGVSEGTVVFGISDVVALGAVTAARAAGRTVGDDLAFAGFDDVPITRDVTPALTTVRLPLDELGYHALRACIDPDWNAEPGRLVGQVILRESTPERHS